ncbi:MAG: helix-turn-helix domain-containing protein [Prevotella sp.]|nr:helix-turn-helix domain-containing protein [Prevotella sp.]MBO5614355.1 helix-turn-helix domain-containing protein [Prevotella sp.]
MYNQIRGELFFAYYGGVAVLCLIACCYLLLRRSNAIAPDITSSKRLRRWTAALFASMALCHVWYLPTYFLTPGDDAMLSPLVCGLLDSLTVLPLSIIVMLVMLQDRRRPLWPAFAMTLPLTAGITWCIAIRSYALVPILNIYGLLMYVATIIYMLHAQRQYGRWLRDNYADLQHKELWQSPVVLLVFLLTFVVYDFETDGLIYEYVMETIDIVLVCYLLWRVETLSDLDFDGGLNPLSTKKNSPPLTKKTTEKIGPLLKLHCEEQQLYLQYDMTVTELARRIGTNRVYLSQHFSMQGTTYNAYINGLRIQHFIRLYREASATHHLVTVQQLAHQSGFRSYGTFNSAFKQSMGKTATEWMLDQGNTGLQ